MLLQQQQQPDWYTARRPQNPISGHVSAARYSGNARSVENQHDSE